MTDNVNPSHYQNGWSNGAEVIDITENLNFNRGNAVKYIARAGKKDSSKELEDLQKAAWYLDREIYRLGGGGPVDPILDQKMAQEVVELDVPQVDYSINVNSVAEAMRAWNQLGRLEVVPESDCSLSDSSEGSWNIPPGDSFFSEHMSQTPTPRVWDDIRQVPDGLAVVDNEGDVWYGDNETYTADPSAAADDNEYAPFTEVLEDE